MIVRLAIFLIIAGGMSAMAITTILPFEMCGTWLFDDTVQNKWSMTELNLDPAKYSGIQHAWFEIFVDNITGDGSKTVELIDGSDVVYATHTVTNDYREPPNNQPFIRMREEFTLNPSATNYYVRFAASAPADELSLNLRTARILLEVVDSSKATVQIPLTEGDESAGGGQEDEDQNNFWAYAMHGESATYAYGYPGVDEDDPYWHRYFLKTEANWSQIYSWTFEVIGGVYSVGDTGYVALFNKTDDVMVAGTELTFTAAAPVRKTVNITNDAANFDDGDEFEIRMKVTGGVTDWVMLYRCALYVTVDPAEKVEIHYKVGSSIEGTGSTPSYDDSVRLLHEPNKYAEGTTFYLEATAKETGGGGNLRLYDSLDFDVGTPIYERRGSNIAVVSNGSLEDPGDDVLAEYEGWVEWKDSALRPWYSYYYLLENYQSYNQAQQGAAIQLNAASDTAIMEISDFGFDDVLPLDMVINEVYAIATAACVGPPQWVTDYVSSLGSGSNLNASIDGISKVSGVEQGVYQVSQILNTTVNWGGNDYDIYYPQNAYSQPEPPRPILLTPSNHSHVFTSSRAWVRGDLLDGLLSMRLRIRMLSTKRFLQFVVTNLKFIVSGGVDVSTLDFSTVTRERLRSDDLTASLTDGNRYIIHYHSSGAGNNVTGHSTVYLIALVTGGGLPGGGGNGNGNGNGAGSRSDICPPYAVIADNYPWAFIDCSEEPC